AVEPTPGAYDDAYLDHIADTVATLARHGILSLLDFHQDLYNERFAGEGWPDWAVQDDGLPNQPNLGFPGNYVGMPALQRAFHDYCLATPNSTDPFDGGACDGFDDDVFANALKHVAATGDAVMLTEFGATQDQGILRRMADRADRNMVSWEEWHYCGCDDPT